MDLSNIRRPGHRQRLLLRRIQRHQQLVGAGHAGLRHRRAAQEGRARPRHPRPRRARGRLRVLRLGVHQEAHRAHRPERRRHLLAGAAQGTEEVQLQGAEHGHKRIPLEQGHRKRRVWDGVQGRHARRCHRHLRREAVHAGAPEPERVRRRALRHRLPPAQEPRPARRVVRREGRAAAGVRVHAQRQPGQGALRRSLHAVVAAAAHRRRRHCVCAVVPPPGVRAAGDPPGHQDQQHPARRQPEPAARRLRARQAHGPQQEPRVHAHRGHHGLPRAGVPAVRQGHRADRRVQLRRRAPRGVLRKAAHRQGRERRQEREPG
uniref:Uncharacterized protein n=1 Tax=Arundo donax TaxID=35708 RepID=A0A0A9DIE2_ARUDO